MRVAQIGPTLEGHGIEVVDRGNLLGPANPWQPPENGFRHLPEVTAWNRAVHEAVYHELGLGRLPILLGGDHCLASARSAPSRATAATPARSCASSGSTRMPTSTPTC